MSVVFDVDDVLPATDALPRDTFQAVLEQTIKNDRYARRVGPSTMRAYAGPHSLVANTVFLNPLANAVHLAFAQHYPLTLTPDAIWTTNSQGCALHVQLNAETRRGRFVEHQGKKALVATFPEEPSTPSDWQALVDEWCAHIRVHVGDGNADFFTNSFTTSGRVERTVSGIVMMDAFEHYFDYMVWCICGIPRIELTGTVEDWREIRRRIELMGDCGLGDWLSRLREICDHFVDSAAGRPDRDFWQCMYKPKEVYGDSVANGWLTRLFPYLETESGIIVNRALTTGPSKHDLSSSPEFGVSPDAMRTITAADGAEHRRRWLSSSVSPSSFPNGLSRVPVTLSHANGAEEEFELMGGLIGVGQHPDTLALQPVLGWAVRTLPATERITKTEAQRERERADLMSYLQSPRARDTH